DERAVGGVTREEVRETERIAVGFACSFGEEEGW
ncbi:hypothetical protein A2U01_0106645, partial [Trifolium medium]|nr:hypothetical protein [Trifolium medium]